MTREERYAQLQRIARSKDGMLQLQSLRRRLCGPTPVRNDDSLERLMKEVLDVEFPQPTLTVSAEVGGLLVPINELCWSTLNFNQFRFDAPIAHYALTIQRDDFVRRLTGEYDRCVAELKADDALQTHAQCFLRDAGYPSMSELLNQPEALSEAIQVYMWDDLLGSFLPLATEKSWFAIHSIESVIATTDTVTIAGRGYQLKDRIQ